MITIIDYGLGNIKAFVNVYEQLNIQTTVARKASDLKKASKIILPGVGAFDFAMSQLNKSGMKEAIEEKVFKDEVPILGICVGMQMLAKSSDEGELGGLGWINGTVKKFDASKLIFKAKLPHMGWNTIESFRENPLLKGFNGDSRFYFLHSFFFECENDEYKIATTDYGVTFASAINKDHIYGIQFHPEKSHSNGMQLLNNFAQI